MTAASFTPEQIKDDAQNRVGRTGVQNATAQAVVVIGVWAAGLLGWSGHLPEAVRGSFVLLLTVGASALMNRHRLRGRA